MEAPGITRAARGLILTMSMLLSRTSLSMFDHPEWRGALDYFSHTRDVRELIEKLAATEPRTLACMHGAAWTGDGAALLRELARRLSE